MRRALVAAALLAAAEFALCVALQAWSDSLHLRYCPGLG